MAKYTNTVCSVEVNTSTAGISLVLPGEAITGSFVIVAFSNENVVTEGEDDIIRWRCCETDDLGVPVGVPVGVVGAGVSNEVVSPFAR